VLPCPPIIADLGLHILLAAPAPIKLFVPKLSVLKEVVALSLIKQTVVCPLIKFS
jgi:hypothetical protein